MRYLKFVFTNTPGPEETLTHRSLESPEHEPYIIQGPSRSASEAAIRRPLSNSSHSFYPLLLRTTLSTPKEPQESFTFILPDGRAILPIYIDTRMQKETVICPHCLSHLHKGYACSKAVERNHRQHVRREERQQRTQKSLRLPNIGGTA